jgi:hypothetical protein
LAGQGHPRLVRRIRIPPAGAVPGERHSGLEHEDPERPSCADAGSSASTRACPGPCANVDAPSVRPVAITIESGYGNSVFAGYKLPHGRLKHDGFLLNNDLTPFNTMPSTNAYTGTPLPVRGAQVGIGNLLAASTCLLSQVTRNALRTQGIPTTNGISNLLAPLVTCTRPSRVLPDWNAAEPA